MFGGRLRVRRAHRSAERAAICLVREAQARGAMQKTRELSSLVAFLRDYPLRIVVEIGTLHGGTLWTWCQIAEPDALIVSVDLPDDRHVGTPRRVDTGGLRAYAQDRQTVEHIRDDSHEERTLRQLREILAGRKIDFLFIDGDHTYEGVRSDFEAYGALVRRGGVIALHDVLPHPGAPACQVHRFWHELERSHRVEEFVDRDDVTANGPWGGIGVVRCDAPDARTLV